MPKEKDFRIFVSPTFESIKQKGYELKGMPVMVFDDMLHYTEKDIEQQALKLLAPDGRDLNFDGAALYFRHMNDGSSDMAPEHDDVVYIDGKRAQGEGEYTIILGLKKSESKK
jgi:hypothetical protein